MELRRKVCTQKGLVNTTDENLITTLYAFCTNSDASNDDNEDYTSSSNQRKNPDEQDENNKTKKTRGLWDFFNFNH